MKKALSRNAGFFFVAPWVIGFIVFTVIPLFQALYLGFTDSNSITAPNFVGFQNYIDLFHDEDFLSSLFVTVWYAIFAVPLGIAASLSLAALLNCKIRGVYLFRTILYLPAVVSGVSIALLWRWILDKDMGLLNMLLARIGIQGPGWLSNPNWVLPSYILIALWGAGGGILTYLAGLQDVPRSLYEAADLDGAGWFEKFVKITVPMLTPVIFYNLIMGIVGAFRKFSDAYIIGGAGNQGRFYMVYLYQNAFNYFKMGYATAMAWILFLIILVLSLLVFKSSNLWVFYNAEIKKGKKKSKRAPHGKEGGLY
ncbi:carbohydrate ABC transporter permease [Caproicibacter sp.]|uniref:carbohydrate ABC transporter permease n=1 Tax=Caproicibacter sp. TaxID=2814884 RepID=UPI003989DF84